MNVDLLTYRLGLASFIVQNARDQLEREGNPQLNGMIENLKLGNKLIRDVSSTVEAFEAAKPPDSL